MQLWNLSLRPFLLLSGTIDGGCVKMSSIAGYLVAIFVAEYVMVVGGFHLDVQKVNHILLENSKVDERNLHQFLEKHEQILLFGTERASDFIIASVQRRKREIRSTHKSIQFNLSDSDSGGFSVKLTKSEILIDDSFVIIESHDNSTQLFGDSYQFVQKYADCFYRNEQAAFDLCDGGVRGLLKSNQTELVIQPLPERFGSDHHIIIKRNQTHDSTVYTHQTDKNVIFEPDMSTYEPTAAAFGYKDRSKRYIDNAKVPDVLHIETAIFIDKDLYKHMSKNFPKNTEAHLVRFVLAMINGVQLLYNHPSLGHPINFILKRLEILHNDPADLRRSSDIDIYLNSFCNWQKKLNPVSDADPVHFDHAVILTGLDLYVVSKNGKVSNQVVGLAPVAGMCTTTSSCTINEGKHFESVFVVAHEIGHNLGMRHDTSENSCDPSLYIMSTTLGSGKITWSSCSRDYLNTFVKTSQASCLFDRGHYGQKLDHAAEGILPGERFDADQQCMLKYGKDSIRSQTQNIADICRDLHCQRDRYTWTSHPALEGTACGTLMWCRSGVCVSKIPGLSVQSSGKHITAFKTIDKKTFIEGLKFASLKQDAIRSMSIIPSWDPWGTPTECESGCLYGESGRLKEGSVGLREYSRTCSVKRKSCLGPNKKYETCIAKQCYSIARTTILEFANQICGRAKMFDADILGLGLQKVSDDAEDACKIFCETKSGEPKTKSWIFPDGTACKVRHADFDDYFYCISGRCEKFTCNASADNFYRIDQGFCPEDVSPTDKVVNSIQQENGRDYKSLNIQKQDYSISSRAENATQNSVNFIFPEHDRFFDSNLYKTDMYGRWRVQQQFDSDKYHKHSLLRSRVNQWDVKSGCHFSCISEAKGIQIVASKINIRTSIQLCAPNTVACDKVLTNYEYATKLCKRYQQKVRGLSGVGMQIAPNLEDPDRSCRVACQDNLIRHRFYLVNGEQGHFPFGTRCNHDEPNRYCVNGKCLRFGDDNTPINGAYNSLAHLRAKRNAKRIKRHYEYFSPINVTERINQEYLDNLIANIDFTHTAEDILVENIDFRNPIFFNPS
ncbi:A disintegrin and metalloproteinase with thrombospondin motifs adt-1 [Toxorhynchites rutilus septentrionalis]|uniref:A disintegrin and metalloproteinase with thrombospondin motifs adt-1 n=1 Tax=Toxorhynchites rutilus septentrionalis TaxID=329112 RepID=UPI0024797505|nr:A disintegrin and metalloproteinase with thrombospondin motifs adt-1 [Toxorhynchites rutilus septentrionalis]